MWNISNKKGNEQNRVFWWKEENRKRKLKKQSKTKKNKNKNSEQRKRNENTRRDKRENKWIEDERKEGIKRQSRHSKRENVELVVVFENKGEYVKGERKGRKSIMKSKRIFTKKKERYIQKGQQKKRNMGKTDVQERDQKRRMSKKHKRRHTKKEKLKKNKKKTERRTNMQKHTNLWICLTKRLKAFENAEVSNTCFS